MKRIGKIFLFVIALSILTMAFVFGAWASEGEDATTEKTTITVGVSTDENGDLYTLESAWAYAEAATECEVEVVLPTDSASFATNFASINQSGKKTTLLLTEDVETTSQLTIKANADVTIDISGCTLTLAQRVNLYYTCSVTIRTSTKAGTLTGGNTGLIYCDPEAASTVCSVNFVSADNGENKLAVTADVPMVIFSNKSKLGKTKILFDGGEYTSDESTIVKLNGDPNSAPQVMELDAEDATFNLAAGGMLWHNVEGTITACGGAFGVGTYARFDGCTFGSINTASKDFFYETASKSRFAGRFFGKLSFADCDFNKVILNGEYINTYVTLTGTDESGNPVYDSNYPLLESGETADKDNNCSYDYRAEAVAAGWTPDGQITVYNTCTFTSSASSFNDDMTGFAGANTVFGDEFDSIIQESSTYQYLKSGRGVATLDQFNALYSLMQDTDSAVRIQLAADIALDSTLITNTAEQLTIDLCGHTLTLSSGASRNNAQGKLHIYSSEEGGVLTSASAFGLFFFNATTGNPTLILGREGDARENLTVSSTHTGSSSGIVTFSNAFKNANATIAFYSLTPVTNHYLVKLNSSASTEDEPTAKITFKNCDIAISDMGLVTYNENKMLDTDNGGNNGLFAVGSSVTVEDCIIRRGDISTGGSALLFYSKVCEQTSGSTDVQSNFVGRFFGTATFKNTEFRQITINTGDLYSTAENIAQNGRNEEYTVPDTWDASKQVTFLEGCTFDMDDCSGINEYANGFAADHNTVIAEGYVLARTEASDTFAILTEDEAVRICWQMPNEDVAVYYKSGVTPYVPTLPSYTVNGNTYAYTLDTEPTAATEDTTYTARWTGGAALSANYTLNAAIDFNAYVPVSAEITHINGASVSTFEQKTVDGVSMWKVTFAELVPSEAYRSQLVSLSVAVDEDTVLTVNRYVSIVGYSKAILASDTDEETKSLVLHTLDYINKTNVYFGGESVSQIESILTEYGFTAYEWEATGVQEYGEFENLTYACLDLSQTPGFVFYVRADYEGAVVVNGVSYSDYELTEVDGTEMKYVVVQIPAYNMANDLAVTVGEDSMVYNLDTYIYSAAADEPYAHALYGYVMAAVTYINNK